MRRVLCVLFLVVVVESSLTLPASNAELMAELRKLAIDTNLLGQAAPAPASIRPCWDVYVGYAKTQTPDASFYARTSVNHMSLFLEPAPCADERTNPHLSEPPESNRVVEWMQTEAASTGADLHNDRVVLYHYAGYNPVDNLKFMGTIARPHKVVTDYRTVAEIGAVPGYIRSMKGKILSSSANKIVEENTFPINLDGFVHVGVSLPIALSDIDVFIYNDVLRNLDEQSQAHCLKTLGYFRTADYIEHFMPRVNGAHEFFRGLKNMVEFTGHTLTQRAGWRSHGHRQSHSEFDAWFNNCNNFARRVASFVLKFNPERFTLMRFLPQPFFKAEDVTGIYAEALVGYNGEGWTDKAPAVLINQLYTQAEWIRLGQPLIMELWDLDHIQNKKRLANY